MSPAQKELLLWHYCLGHVYLSRIQCILCNPCANEKDDKRHRMVTPRHKGSSPVDLTHIVCEACQLAKQKSMHPCSKHSTMIDEEEGKLSEDILLPSQHVSCDQHMSTVLGRRAHAFGKEVKSKRLGGGIIFIDHATNFITHQHQVNLTAAETVCSKHSSELLYSDRGVVVKE